MKKVNLKTVKEYCDLIVAGTPRTKAAKEVFGSTSALAKVEESDEYRVLLPAVQDRVRKELNDEVEKLQKKKLASYHKLLDEGNSLIDNASSSKEKMQAQENQRRNLAVPLVEQAESWNSMNRNQEKNDVLEGIIID